MRVNNFGTLFLKREIEYPRTSLRVLIILGQKYHGNWFLSPNKARLWLLERPIYQNYFQFRILFGIFNFWVRFKKTDKTTCLRINALILNIEKTFVRNYITKNLFLLRCLKSTRRIFDRRMKFKFQSTSWKYKLISYTVKALGPQV